MTILTSSFYSVLQYYNNHHAHIEHTHYNIEQKFSQVFIKTFFFDYSNAIFERYKKRFLLHFGTSDFCQFDTSKIQCLCGFWFVQHFGTNHLFFDKN